jgi:hypothetical protein
LPAINGAKKPAEVFPLSNARNLFGSLILLVLLASLTGCSSLTVNYDYDQNVEWGKYKSYAWMEKTDSPTNPTQPMPDTKLWDQRFANSVKYEMGERGISESDNPDLLVIYHFGSTEKIQVTDWGYRYSDYYWGYGGRQIYVYQFTEGSLVIDLIDAETKNLVWRGTGTGVVEQKQRTPEEWQARIDNIIHKIMESFPPN